MSHDTNSLSGSEVVVSLLSGGSAVFIMMVGVSIWLFDVPLGEAGSEAPSFINRAVGVLSIATLLFCIVRYLIESPWGHFLYSGLCAIMSLVFLLIGLRWTLGNLGGESIGHTMGFIIGFVAAFTGIAGVLSSVLAFWEGTKTKAAEPGATDNPDDAQRLREDH